MNVAVIDGYLGAGKTLAMSILAEFYRQRSGCALYSNYGIRRSFAFEHYNQFLELTQHYSSIVCLDEAHTDLDSRSFNTNVAKFFSHLMFYFRKLRTTVFFATPDIENLDSRVRSICNLYIKADKDKHYFYYTMYDMQRMKFLKRYKIKKDNAFLIASNIYDTHNIVTPIEFPQDKKEFTELIIKLKELNNEYYMNTGEADRLRDEQAKPVLQNNIYIPA